MAKPTKKKTFPLSKQKKKPVKSPKKMQCPDRGFDIDFDPAAQLEQNRRTPRLSAPEALHTRASPIVLNRLWAIIENRREADPEISHSARLLSRGTPRIAQKLGEEAVECLLELTAGNRVGLINESADVLYHLLVAWVSADVKPEEVWRELEQREKVSYLSDVNDVPLKRLLGSVQIGTTKIP